MRADISALYWAMRSLLAAALGLSLPSSSEREEEEDEVGSSSAVRVGVLLRCWWWWSAGESPEEARRGRRVGRTPGRRRIGVLRRQATSGQRRGGAVVAPLAAPAARAWRIALFVFWMARAQMVGTVCARSAPRGIGGGARARGGHGIRAREGDVNQNWVLAFSLCSLCARAPMRRGAARGCCCCC